MRAKVTFDLKSIQRQLDVVEECAKKLRNAINTFELCRIQECCRVEIITEIPNESENSENEPPKAEDTTIEFSSNQ